MNSVVQAIAPPIVVVDGFQFDLSNLGMSMLSLSYDNNSRPEEDDSSAWRLADSYASYPLVDEIPACLDVDNIFDKLKSANLLKKGKLANPRLASRNPSMQQKKKSSPTRRPRNINDVESKPFSVTLDNMIRQDDRKVQEDPYRRQDDNRRQEDGRSHRRYRAEDEYNASSYNDYRPTDRQASRDDGYRHHDDHHGGGREEHRGRPAVEAARYNVDDYGDDHRRGDREEHRGRPAVEPPRYDYDDYDDEQLLPSHDEEDRTLVEVMPGTFVPLRGSAETWEAVQSGHITRTTCFSCMTRLVCIDDADMVMCPECQLISPVDGGVGGGGLGLGMKADDAFHELERFRRISRRTYR
jgi:hypothetical protein